VADNQRKSALLCPPWNVGEAFYVLTSDAPAPADFPSKRTWENVWPHSAHHYPEAIE
jgi:hypothetical protein